MRTSQELVEPAPPLRELRLDRGVGLLVALAVFELVFFVAYRFGMSFTQAAASPFWFPDTVLLVALLLVPPRRWWLFLLAPLPIRLFSEVSGGVPAWFLWTTYLIDSLKALAAAALLRRFRRDPLRLETVRQLGVFAAVAVFLIPALAAFAGAAARSGLGADFWTSWAQWFLGNAMTHLVVTPAVLCWLVAPARGERMRPGGQLEGALVAAALALTCWLAFDSELGGSTFEDVRLFAPLPFLFWAAIRFGMAGASGGVAVMTFFCVRAAIDRLGPFVGDTPSDTTLLLQQFLAVRAPALYVIATLVHQNEAAERELDESERRFRSVADTTPVLLWISDRMDRLTFVNRAWLRFSGGLENGGLDSSWLERVHPEDSGALTSGRRREASHENPFGAECRLRRNDGTYVWFLVNQVPRYSTSGEFAGYVGSGVDLSVQKDAAEQMQRSRMHLAHVARVATMGELTASVAHELRQPLGAILANTEAAEMLLARGDVSPDELREILADIRADDSRAGEILSRMRRLLERRDFARKAVEIDETIEETLRLLRIEAVERRVAIEFEPAGGLPAVIGDRVHLQQVVMNLVLNGFDAMESVSEVPRRLLVRTGRDGDGAVTISVRDWGRGIAPESMPLLFEPFWTTKSRGLGMGLPISRSIIEAHEGRIFVESNPDAGTTFRVVLPKLAPTPSTTPTTPTTPTRD